MIIKLPSCKQDTLIYNCKQNDNTIKIDLDFGEIESINIGNKNAPEYGYIVIGFKDLQESLKLAGYDIERREDR